MPLDLPKDNALYSILPQLKILESWSAARTQFFHTGFCLAGLNATVHFDLAWQGAQPTISIFLILLGAGTIRM